MGVYLSKANTTKDSSQGESAQLRFATCSMQGWRVNMEDAHIADVSKDSPVSIFGVFDGHGGQEVAKFCAKHFINHLRKNENFEAGKYKEALERNFLRMDELIQQTEGQEELKQLKPDSDMGNSYAGCTANVCIVTKTEIYCANAGDSRAVVYWEDGTVTPLSKDHKPDIDTEKERITGAGGYVRDGRVNDNLNLTRAIGDFEYKRNTALPPEKQIITAFPDITITKFDKKPRLLVLGCDGIWETLSIKDICETLYKKLSVANSKIIPAAEELLDQLVAKDTTEGVGCDNMTCIVVQFMESLPSGKD